MTAPWRSLAGGAALAAALAAPLGAPLGAQPAEEDPDWPCIQRKVPSLTLGSVWSGPPIEEAGRGWRQDAEVAALVSRLSQRRLPLEEAEADALAFAEGLGEAERDARLARLFQGLFDVMNAERGEIMEGIARYTRRQRELAAEVRAEAASLDEARRAPDADPAALQAAQADLDWSIRVYNDRRASLTFICDAPRLVEQRLFALGRTVTGLMAGDG